MLYIPGFIATSADGTDYNELYFQFNDRGASSFALQTFTLVFNVIKVNLPPVLTFNNQTGSLFAVTQTTGLPITPVLTVTDPDIGFGFMTLNLTLTSSGNAATFDMSAINKVAGLPASGSAGIASGSPNNTITNTQIIVTAQLSVCQALIAAIDVDANNAAVASLIITANDNGFTGQCAADTMIIYTGANTCPLTANLTITMSWTSAVVQTNSVAIGASAGAAGFAGAAAIAAGLLFRKFNKKAEESYAPWDESGADMGAVSNPLYEQSGAQGVNPLFESKAEN